MSETNTKDVKTAKEAKALANKNWSESLPKTILPVKLFVRSQVWMIESMLALIDASSFIRQQVEKTNYDLVYNIIMKWVYVTALHIFAHLYFLCPYSHLTLP